MANPLDPVLSHHTSQERQPAAVPELPNDQSPKHSRAEDHTEQTEAASERKRSSLKNGQASEQKGADLQRLGRLLGVVIFHRVNPVLAARVHGRYDSLPDSGVQCP